MPPLITLFSAPKPFINPHITIIQMNAIRSWMTLGNEVEVVLIGDEEGIEAAANQTGANYQGLVKRNEIGTPLISSIFSIGRQLNSSPLLAYINADILLFPNFVEVARKILDIQSKFLIVGQRWDMDIQEPLDFSEGWQQKLAERCDSVGRLHTRGGSDYFIYPRECFTTLPDFTVGRAGWDNWMFYQARRNKWLTIDATPSIKIIHQDHDYSHLPGGQSHYKLPETGENIRLAGGPRTIFTLMDANYEFKNGMLCKFPFSWKKFWRDVEVFPLIYLNSKVLAQIFFAIFHPQKAYMEFRNGISTRRKWKPTEKSGERRN